MLKSINPKNGKLIGEYAYTSAAQMEKQISQAFALYQSNYHTGGKLVTERVEKIKKFAEALKHNQEKIAQTMADEMGKPVFTGRSEVQKSIAHCHYSIEHAEKYLEPEHIKTDYHESFVF